MKFFEIISDYADEEENKIYFYVVGAMYLDVVFPYDICEKFQGKTARELQKHTVKQIEESLLSNYIHSVYAIKLGHTKEEIIKTLQSPAKDLDLIQIMAFEFKRNVKEVEFDIDKKAFDLWLLKARLQSQKLNNSLKELVPLEELKKKYRRDYDARCKHLTETMYCLKLQKYSPVLAKKLELWHLYQYAVDEFIFFVVYIGDNKFFNLGMNIDRFQNLLAEKTKSIIEITSEDILYDTGLNGEFVKELCKN